MARGALHACASLVTFDGHLQTLAAVCAYMKVVSTPVHRCAMPFISCQAHPPPLAALVLADDVDETPCDVAPLQSVSSLEVVDGERASIDRCVRALSRSISCCSAARQIGLGHGCAVGAR